MRNAAVTETSSVSEQFQLLQHIDQGGPIENHLSTAGSKCLRPLFQNGNDTVYSVLIFQKAEKEK